MPTAEIGGVKLSFEDTGGGRPPVLFLHAFPLAAAMWAPQMDALGERYRCVAVDLMGFGDSEAPEDAESYSMERYADQTAGLLDHLGIDRAVVVGLSMGGYIALAMWRRHRDRIRALVLADTRAEPDAPDGVAKRTAQQEQVRAEGIDDLADTLLGALLGATTRERKPDVVERTRRLAAQPPAGYIGALEAIKSRPDSRGDLPSIDVPTLVVVGEQDALTPPEVSRRLHEHIGGSQMVVVPEAGHISNLERPDAFNGALAGFLSKLQ